MAQMSMNKVIHCAVRRDLARFRAALSSFRDGDTARAAALRTAWANFDAQLTEHHEGEHEVAWPAMLAVGVSKPSITAFDEEHAKMAADLAAAGTAMEKFAASATKADADAAEAAMATLEVTTTTHLDHEERETENLLVEKTKAKDPTMKQMGRQFSKRASLPQAGTFFAWMDDGATPDERAGLRQSVPGPVLSIIGGIFGRSYRRNIAPVWRS